MFVNILKKNLPRFIALILIGILFITLVFATNYDDWYSEEAYNSFLSLPIYLKLIFLVLIPILGDLDYLFQFTMVYIIPLTLIYSFSMGRSANIEIEFEELLPISKRKRKLINIESRLLLLFSIILIYFITTIIVTSICYKAFNLFILNGYIYLLLINLIVFFLAYLCKNLKNKFKIIILVSCLAYIIISFLLSNLVQFSLFYYLSPFSIILQPINNPLIYILPIIILSIEAIIYIKFIQEK